MNHLPRLAICLLLLFGAHAILAQDVPELIRQYSEAIHEGTDGALEGRRVAAVTLLPAFYARREFAPVWDDSARYDALLKIVQDSTLHGLDPADYHADILAKLSGAREPRQYAARDILATDALIRLGYHLHFGKIDPVQLDPVWNLTRRLNGEEPLDLLERALAAPSLAGFIDQELAPTGTLYNGLRTALARYREIARAGGWPSVPSGATLKPGERSPRITSLRARLAVTDPALPPELHQDAPDPALYDAPLVAAVERFQQHQGLDVDGAVGKRTLAALNVPVEARIDQLRINLERARWVFRDREPRYLVVNIAGFRAYLMENGKVAWETRVVVGKPYRQTPIFKARLTYLVLNPTWTVPPTILTEDVIPRLRRDPDYLAENNMVLLDAAGRVVEVDRAELAQAGVNNFPYTVRQEPGPKNALGRIKFMFPNEHAVYLHDTPSRNLFARAERSFSSGCIRIEHPLVLAERLLMDPINWNQAKLEEHLSTGTLQTVHLKTPISIFLMYWTAEPGADGQVMFYNDIYSRDQAVLAALKEPFRFIPLR